MCLSMLRCLVMGIKKFIAQKRCKTCSILIPSAWTYCTKHGTFKPYDKQKFTEEFLRKQHLKYVYKNVTFKCDREKALESNMLVFDEITGNIIGYRESIK